MCRLTQEEELPRLLDVKRAPSPVRLRWYWQYVGQWRRWLFQEWRQARHDTASNHIIADAVDDLVGICLLKEYCRRAGLLGLPSIQETCQAVTPPTVSRIMAAIADSVRDPLLASALASDSFGGIVEMPRDGFPHNWESRIRDATWLLHPDKQIPLTFFGDFHQFCTGNPLSTEAGNASGKDTRRSRGMYYTPAALVDYLVSVTLAKATDHLSTDEVMRLRILDPACGCGAFLIACLRYLVRRLGQSSDDNPTQAKAKVLHLLKHVLQGYDIDSRAVQWTNRLLFLAAWEELGSRIESCDSRLPLPNPSCSINCRSFLGMPLATPDPSVSNLDVILGGPPFVRTSEIHRSQPHLLPLYRRRYLSARQGQFDLYMLFVEQGLDLLKQDGHLAFSLSNSFLRTDSGRILRGYIAANGWVEEIVEFEDPRTYPDATTQIALLRLRKRKGTSPGRYVMVKGCRALRRKLEHLALGQPCPEISISDLPTKATASSRWSLTASDNGQWLAKLFQAGIPLGQLVRAERGFSTGMDSVLLLREAGRAPNGSIVASSRILGTEILFEQSAVRRVVRGHQLRGYRPPRLKNVCPFPYEAGRILSEASLRSQYPSTFAYLSTHRDTLARRSLAKGYPWYTTFLHMPSLSGDSPRLMSARITAGRGFSLISDPELLGHDSVVVLTTHSEGLDPHYLLGLLNSDVFSRYVSLTMPPISVGRYSLRLSRLRRFPVPDPTHEENRPVCQRIAELVRELLQCIAGHRSPDLVHSVIERDVGRLYGLDL